MAERGLFLDFDGTLADSLPAMRQAYAGFLGAFGRTGSDAEFEALNGPPLRIVVERLKAAHGLEPALPELMALYRRRIAEASPLIRPAPGADALLAAAAELGWATAVVTSGPREPIAGWLERFGLAVDVVIGGEDAPPGKPDPAPYLMALQRTGCVAARSIAVEDSFKGATAAIAAGLPTWMVGGAEAPPGLAGRAADLSAVVNHVQASAEHGRG
jgi:HAD superfamily hydrolase (TIGR01509 family)